MTAETAQKFRALEDQAKTIRDVFTGAGYEPVAPAILQPADIFLNQIGEPLSGKTYVFRSLDGEVLCLRPDLTVPTCRLYLERHPHADCVARYCYNGPAFRFNYKSRGQELPREFRQAGIENIGVSDKAKAETEVLKLVSESVVECGLSEYSMRFGDLGLFNALMNALDMPERWRLRLQHQFWNRSGFRGLLSHLSQPISDKANGINTILAKLTAADMERAPELVSEYLDSKGIPLAGKRELNEITERLLDQLADIKADPLPKDVVELIENYLSISSRPKAAGARIADLTRAAGISIDQSLQQYMRRLDLFAEAGIDLKNAVFCAEYGREFEYYTGLVFQLEAPKAEGEYEPIAGGGRYDNLIAEIEKGHSSPAVGCAIHTENLLAAVEGTI